MSPRNSANGSNIIFYHKIIILDHPQTFGLKSVQQMFKDLESRSVKDMTKNVENIFFKNPWFCRKIIELGGDKLKIKL